MNGSTAKQEQLGWWQTRLQRVYESLTLNDSPAQSDLIFVLAGRMERKQYGIELYRAAFAPRLLISVGRFEVSKIGTVDFGSPDELIARRDRTEPDRRHFFCDMKASGVHIEEPHIRRWNTYGEILALREYLGSDLPRSVIVVSTDVHLRRTKLTFEKVFGDAPLEVRYCPVPPRSSSLRKDRWWTRPQDREYVLKEVIKLPAYRMILRTPDWMIGQLMRLRD